MTDHYGGLMTCPALDSRGRLLVASGYDSLVCFSPDGSVAWNAEVPGLYGGGITVGYDDRVYVQSCDDNCYYCLDANGQRGWWGITQASGDLNNVCALADSSVLFAGYGECIDCIDWNGQFRWRFCIADSLDVARHPRPRKLEGDGTPTPLVGPDGNIYMNYYEGLCCISVGDVRLANTAWPTYNHDNSRSGWAGRQQR